MSECDYLFRVIFIGEPNVGKSSIFQRYNDGTFSMHCMGTIGVTVHNSTLNVDGEYVKLQVWDTAGQERFGDMNKIYYTKIHACFLVFDVTEESSFNKLDKWMENVRQYAPEDTLRILIGNKIDLESSFHAERANEYAKHHNMPIFFTSAKTGENITNLYSFTAKELKEKYPPNSIKTIPEVNSINQSTQCW